MIWERRIGHISLRISPRAFAEDLIIIIRRQKKRIMIIFGFDVGSSKILLMFSRSERMLWELKRVSFSLIKVLRV
jgi:hypothetical protein